MRIFTGITAVAALLLAVSLGSCGGRGGSASIEADTVLYRPSYASGFIIGGVGDSRLLTVTNPWQGADSVNMTLLMTPDGSREPDGFEGQTLHGTARRIVGMSSSHVAMLDALGLTDRIAGVSGLRYITSPQLQARRDSVADVGYEGNVNYEALLGADPDLVLLYGVMGSSSMEPKLRELGIPYIYIGDYLEESPVGKAEWVVALAEICGVRSRGEDVFAGIPGRYEKLRRLVADSTDGHRPDVMLNTPYGDSWFMPPADSYMARLVRDAGGRYMYEGNTGNSSLPIDIEEAFALVQRADYWINVSDASTTDGLRRLYPKFADAPCVASRHVYNNTRRATPGGGNDFYESAVMNPDLVLRDLIMIFHPGLLPDGEFVYYRRLD